MSNQSSDFSMKESKGWTSAHLLCVVVLSSLVASFCTLAAFFFFQKTPSAVFFNGSNCVVIGDRSVCFFSKSMSDTDTMTVMTSFYSNIIVVIIAMLTLAATFAAITIRASAKAHVETELPGLTVKFFEGEGGKVVLSSIKSDDIGEIRKKLDELYASAVSNEKYIYAIIDKIDEMQHLIDDGDFGASVDLHSVDDAEGEALK